MPPEIKVKLSDVIAEHFYKLHNDIKHNRYTHYWLKGGRASTKSTFTAIEIVKGIMEDPNANALVMRQVADTMRSTVFNQLMWAIDILQVSEYWRDTQNPLEIIYKPTGQKITFRGVDNPEKLKSIKFRKGYCKFVWYEELTEFKGYDKITTINQSVLRGGDCFCVFYTYNPPESIRNWVNEEVLQPRADKIIHHSTYLDIPAEWLGKAFIADAEHMKKVKPEMYRHQYLGEVTGTGGEVFNNLTVREITNAEIASFDRIYRGLDFGYAGDPLHYSVSNFDKTRRRLYIFGEIQQLNMKIRAIAEGIKELENSFAAINSDYADSSEMLIMADSAEPRSIAELRDYGLNIWGAKKGPNSVPHGIKFLQDLEEIIIDPIRCPNTKREFNSYELEKDKNGNFKSGFPDKDNHSIDAVRYALESSMKGSNFSFK